MKNQCGLNYNLISKYRTALMGIAILLIMFCHMDVALEHNNMQITSIARVLHVFTVGVDVFMFLSGFGLYYSYTKNRPSYRDFETKRLSKILPQYLVIGGVTYAIYDLIIHRLGFAMFIKDITFISWIIGGSARYWYILAIIVFYLIFPVLFRFIYTGKHGLLKTIVFSACWWIAEEFLSGQIPTVGIIRIALARLPIFVIGLYCGSLSYEGKKPKRITVVLLLVFGYLMFTVLKTSALKTVSEYLYYPGRAALAISILITTICLFEMLEKYNRNLLSIAVSSFGWFGGLTLELYLLHQSYMILLEYPYTIATYPVAAFILPTATAAAIYVGRIIQRKGIVK